jgi:class 3 adenylate cyclase
MERRPITVMLCDLIDSMSLASRLDAEDWRNLVNAYLDAASEGATQMGGSIAKKLGDGLIALFGHPIVQENDSERAVRAALGIQHALDELNRKNAHSDRPELVARIGARAGRSWSMRPEKSSAMRPTWRRACRRWPSEERCL